MPYGKKTKRRPSITRRAKISALICAVLAAGLVFTGLYLRHQETLEMNALEARSYGSTPATPTPVVTPPPSAQPTKPVTVGIVSDSHAYNADSWWRQTVLAGSVPGVAAGPFESQPGALSTSLTTRLDAAAAGADYVIVQAGTNDLLSAATPSEAMAGIKELVLGIRERGASPVLASVPPSDTHGEGVLELDRMIADYSAAESVPLLDLTSPVVAEDGTWRAGLTDDGIHANRAGSDLMASAATQELSSKLLVAVDAT